MPGSDSEYEHISEKMRDLIRLLLTPNPDKRPSIIELLKIVQNFDSQTESILKISTKCLKEQVFFILL